MDIKELMHSGKLYDACDDNVLKEQYECLEMMRDFNLLRPSQLKERDGICRKMFASFGKDSYIEQPLCANWGGHHVYIGDRVYANSNLTLVDDTYIYIENDVMMGPNVTLCTAAHPIDAKARSTGYQYNKSVKIGSGSWLGAGVTVLPGVTIGKNTVIGAGSVVNKDIPDNVVAAGNPCRVLRKIDENDAKYYDKTKLISECLNVQL